MNSAPHSAPAYGGNGPEQSKQLISLLRSPVLLFRLPGTLGRIPEADKSPRARALPSRSPMSRSNRVAGINCCMRLRRVPHYTCFFPPRAITHSARRLRCAHRGFRIIAGVGLTFFGRKATPPKDRRAPNRRALFFCRRRAASAEEWPSSSASLLPWRLDERRCSCFRKERESQKTRREQRNRKYGEGKMRGIALRGCPGQFLYSYGVNYTEGCER